MKKYSVIVFDLGNVLLPFDYNRMLVRLNGIRPGLGEQFIKFYNDNYSYHRKFEKGVMTQEEFLELMLESCGRALDNITFCKYYSEIFHIDGEVASLLPVLKEKNFRLFLLSNTNPIHREFGYSQYDFLKYFEKLFLSYELGAVKPEPEIFKAVENYTRFSPDEHLFIDDIYEYTEAARSIGWDAIHFVNYRQLITEFNKRGII